MTSTPSPARMSGAARFRRRSCGTPLPPGECAHRARRGRRPRRAPAPRSHRSPGFPASRRSGRALRALPADSPCPSASGSCRAVHGQRGVVAVHRVGTESKKASLDPAPRVRPRAQSGVHGAPHAAAPPLPDPADGGSRPRCRVVAQGPGSQRAAPSTKMQRRWSPGQPRRLVADSPPSSCTDPGFAARRHPAPMWTRWSWWSRRAPPVPLPRMGPAPRSLVRSSGGSTFRPPAGGGDPERTVGRGGNAWAHPV